MNEAGNEAGNEATLAPLLRAAIEALTDPTRGAILVELGRAGEMTATQLARQLGLSANTIYHHMRVLTSLGLLEPPRVVPGKTYVEKYYRVKRELLPGTQDPEWVEHVLRSLTAEERKAFLVGSLLRASQILRQAAHRYERMDAQALDELFSRRQLGMLSINQMRRDRLQYRLEELRELIAREAERFPDIEDEGSATDIVIMAGLPFFWAEEPRGDGGGSDEPSET